MTRGPAFGLLLATAGTLFLTPDALLMRLSEMGGFQMSAWRGFLMGGALLSVWALTSRTRADDLAQLRTPAGLVIVVAQFFNSLLFCLGIGAAPAAVVLFGVAAVPIFAALLSWAVLREPTGLATWAAIGAVTTGIAIAVSGGDHGTLSLDPRAVVGALFGLGVAVMLAVNFVVLRAQPRVPILLAIGVGAFLAGINGLIITGPENMISGHPWAMIATGAVVLPVSFFLLSLASRYTHAANVSLLMLMETVLAPIWVWLGVGEAPTGRMLLGGGLVVVSLAIYVQVTRERA